MIDVAKRTGKRVEAPDQAELDTLQSEADQPTLVAGTAKGLWIFKTEQQTELADCSITAIAPDANGLWVIANRHAVWHRNVNGEWQQIALVQDLRLNCLLPIEKSVLVGTSEAHLLQLVGNNVETVTSFEQAEGRNEWYTPWGGLPDVRSLALGAAGERYVNIHVGGILRSQDQGQTWQPTLDIHADVHEVRTLPDRPGFVLAATAEGFAVSQDSGETWSFDRANLHATYARAIAICGDVVLISVSMGPQGRKAALYRRSLDPAGTFEKCQQELPEWFSDNINTGCLAGFETVAAFGTSDGQIFLSNDAGLTWKRIASGLAPIHCLSLI